MSDQPDDFLIPFDRELDNMLKELGFPNGSIPVPVPRTVEPSEALTRQIYLLRSALMRIAVNEGLSLEQRRLALDELQGAVKRAQRVLEKLVH